MNLGKERGLIVIGGDIPSGETPSGDTPAPGTPIGIPMQRNHGHSRSVLVCDDRSELRESIVVALGGFSRFRIVGEASDAASCLQGVLESQPDILILDVSMPGGGPTVARAVRALHPAMYILVHSGRSERRIQREMLDAGADHYLIKTGRLGPLIQALDRAAGR